MDKKSDCQKIDTPQRDNLSYREQKRRLAKSEKDVASLEEELPDTGWFQTFLRRNVRIIGPRTKGLFHPCVTRELSSAFSPGWRENSESDDSDSGSSGSSDFRPRSYRPSGRRTMRRQQKTTRSRFGQRKKNLSDDDDSEDSSDGPVRQSSRRNNAKKVR